MAKMARARADLIEAIRAMGIEPDDTRKIIIEVRSSDSRCGSLGDEDERVCARERRHDGRHGCIPADGVVAWW